MMLFFYYLKLSVKIIMLNALNMSIKQISFFGLGLRAFAKANGLTLRKLSDKTGFSIPYLSEIMRGAKSPDEFVMRKIGDHIGIFPEHLMATGRKIDADSQELMIQAFGPLIERLANQLPGRDNDESGDNDGGEKTSRTHGKTKEIFC
jgi:transcriptional regulator with XRE-family HTH domain